MSKFTPGPWKLDKYGSVITKPGERVCFYGLSLSGGAEAKANGILASAAPDMYEALQEFVAWVEVSQEHGTIKLSTSSQAYIKAKAALAKADGK